MTKEKFAEKDDEIIQNEEEGNLFYFLLPSLIFFSGYEDSHFFLSFVPIYFTVTFLFFS